MGNWNDTIQSICTVIASAISAYALIKVNKSDVQDRIKRAQWAFEAYLIALGKCIENPCQKNYEEYNACYTMYKVYADKEFQKDLEIIDELLREPNKDLVKLRVNQLAQKYSEFYNMNRFLPKKRF